MGAFSLMFFLFNSELVFRFSQNIQNFPTFCVFLNIENCVVMKIFLCLVVALAVCLTVCGMPIQPDEEVMLTREAWICTLCTRYYSQAWICTLCTREKRSMPYHDAFTTGPHDALDNLEDWYQNNKPAEVETTAATETPSTQLPEPAPETTTLDRYLLPLDIHPGCIRCAQFPKDHGCLRCVR